MNSQNDKPFWGELHTHSEHSDGNGRAADCFAIARSHLDFWALSDHAYDDTVFYVAPDSQSALRRGPDQPVLNHVWDKIQELCRSYEAPGSFIPILAYEWTNFRFGHHNVYYYDYDQPIRMPATLPELYESLRGVNALVIPHHTGYPPGKCGKNWDYHNEALTPFVEIYSVHGSSEEPGGIRPLLTTGSWMGPGASGGSVQEGLARGHKLGIIASSDAHADHPGAYDLGLVAAYAPELTRASIWQAFKQKRVYGVTGDRIQLRFAMNGHPMGSIVPASALPAGAPRVLEVEAVAWDSVERLDVFKNNTLLHSAVEPQGRVPGPATGPRDREASSSADRVRFRFMVEWGWDRWATNEWEGTLEVPGGRVLQAIPCYRNRVEARVGHGVTRHDASSCTWTSRTPQIQGNAPARRFGDAIWLEVECDPQAPMRLTMVCTGYASTGGSRPAPAELSQRTQQLTLTPQDVLSRASLTHMQPVADTDNGNHWGKMDTLAKFRVNQGSLTDRLSLRLHVEDDAPLPAAGGADFYYVRVIQRNGHRAWSSPIWVQ